MIEKLPVELILMILKFLYGYQPIKFSLLSRKLRLIMINNNSKFYIKEIKDDRYNTFLCDLEIALPRNKLKFNIDYNRINKDIFNLNAFNNIQFLRLRNHFLELKIENLKLESLSISGCDNLYILENNISNLYLNDCHINYIEKNNLNFIYFDDCEFERNDEISIINNIKDIVGVDMRNTQLHNHKLFSKFKKQNSLDFSWSNVFITTSFKNIENLNLSHTSVIEVNCLNKVKNLNLSYTDVKDVNNLGEVKELNLSNTQINDEGIKGLGKNNSLDLSNTNVKNVKHLGNVEILDLNRTKVENEDIINLKNVKILNLTHTSVTDFSFLTNVKDLNISYNTIEKLPEKFNKEVCLTMKNCHIKPCISFDNIKYLNTEHSTFLHKCLDINGCSFII